MRTAHAHLLPLALAASALPLFVPASAHADPWAVDFAAGARLRVDAYSEPLFGLSPAEDFTSTQYRLTFSADLRHRSGVGLFAEIGAFDEEGRSPGPRPVDVNYGDVLQGYLRLEEGGGAWRTELRLGRQLNPQGESRLNASREAPNAARTFDGLSVFAESDRWRVSAFAVKPVELSFDAFDDESDDSEAFWGLYVSRPPQGAPFTADVYYFGRRDENIRWAQASGVEERHSIGVRLYGGVGPYDWNHEAIYQFGSFNQGAIAAWGAAFEASRRFEFGAGVTQVGLRGNAVSGDRDLSDPDLQTFSAIYPRFTYYSPAATLAPANSWDLQAFAAWRPIDAFSASVSAGALWKLQGADAVYAVPYIALPNTAGRAAGPIANLYAAEASWRPSGRWSLSAAVTYLEARAAIEDAGGRSATYAGATLSYRR